MKICAICKETKEFHEFHKNSRNIDGHDRRCKKCRKEEAARKYREYPFTTLSRCKKSECNKKGVDFNLDAKYLESIWTGICPITGVELLIGVDGGSHRQSAHLDRFDPTLGYVKGNVAYISGRANRIKYNATADELRQIADWMEGATTIP